MAQWARFPFRDALFANADETILRRAPAAAENAYANAAGGFSRMPGIRRVHSIPGAGRVYLYDTEWRGDMIAATESGRVYRIGRDLSLQDVTGVPLSGGRRPVWAATEEELCIAAGGPILRLARDRTDRLSDEAPDSTHVAFVDGYLVAIEPFSGRFRYSDPGEYRVWNDLSVFTAEAKPDDLTAAAVTPYRELLLAGPLSIEQFERLPNGDRPFFRRWATGEGLAYPYTLVVDTSGTYGVNLKTQMVRFQAQVSRDQSADIGLALTAVDDWTDAWAQIVTVGGQHFVVLQAPNASVSYGQPGATFLLDYRASKWSFLHGWDTVAGAPSRWPAWSVGRAWGRTFVGLTDGIGELTREAFDYPSDVPARFLVRSAHVGEFGASRVDDVRIQIKRGLGGYGTRPPRMLVRMIRDNEKPTRWVEKSLGLAGDTDLTLHFGPMGCAYTWQMEIVVTDPVPVEFVEAWIRVERLKW